MVKIKSYTDLKQSRKLAEFLPHESADMFYMFESITGELRYHPIIITEQTNRNYIISEHNSGEGVVSWSLAALLSVLPFHIITNNQGYAFSMHKGLNKDGETYMFRYNIFNTDVCLYKTEYYNNPIDACYEMIIKLHELNLL